MKHLALRVRQATGLGLHALLILTALLSEGEPLRGSPLPPPAAPAAPQKAAAKAGLPPVVDRELFFGDPEISQARLSPDGAYIAFVKPLNGTRNIWVKKTSEPFASARPITADTKRPIPTYFWSRDGKYVLYIQDKGGDENYNVYAVSPSAPKAEGSEVPAARNLTELKNVRAAIYDVPKADPDTIYVGINDRDAAWHDLYKVSISTGERTKLRENKDRLTRWVFDLSGKARLATRSTESGDTEVLKVTDSGLVKIAGCSVLETCQPVRFHKDGKRVYYETNAGEGDLVRLALLDADTGKEDLVESDPEKKVDFGDAGFSEATDELVVTAYEDDKTRYYFKDKAYAADFDFLKKRFPGREVNRSSGTRDDKLFLIVANSDVEPGEVYLFDRASKKLTLQYKVRERLPRAALSPMKPISYPSSDGLSIPAYLTIPKGSSGKNLPLIVLPHGGPWGRDGWGYSALSQFFANRGYAVLQPNFRASTGYGKKFLDAGNNEWGQKMQDDLTWGVKHLVKTGVADPKRVGILGGSYGGYATLAGVAFTPDVYAAGVSIVGPSNLLTLLDTIPPYWEAGRKLFHTRMGDPNTAEGKARLMRQSPLNSADKIKTPLMIVQGANDPRVKKAESEQIVVALRDRGFPVEYLLADDEGHGFQKPVNQMAWTASAETFLAKHLGGRAQKTATPEVEKRLAELTVDPKTVKLAAKMTASAEAPKPTSTLAAGTTKWQGELSMGERKMPFEVTREIKEEGGAYVVTDSAQMPMGAMTDAVTLDKGTLTLLKRHVVQGPAIIDIAVKDGKASGSMAMGGDPKPFETDLGGPLFADGAGSGDVVATLPLAAGYTSTFRNLDLRTQKAKLVSLTVSGEEKVKVPAGEFDTYKVDLAHEDGGKMTLWVAKDGHKVVKTSTQPGGSPMSVTTELMAPAK